MFNELVKLFLELQLIKKISLNFKKLNWKRKILLKNINQFIYPISLYIYDIIL